MASLSSKELSALEDQLNYEQMLVKKYRAFSSQISDPQLKTTCEQVASRHQDHFNKLMNHLS